MNNIHNSIKYTVLLGALCSALAGINSCSSRESDSPSKEEINGTVLRVNVAGIADNIEVEASPIASKNSMAGISSGGSVIAPEKMLNLNGFDALVSVEKSNPNNKPDNAAIASSSKINATAATSLMGVGVRYRLMIYDAADVNHTTPVINQVCISGTDPLIKIDAGKAYTWYALSLNENTTVPVVNNGIVAKTGLKNKDILLANGILNTQYGENYLNIIFNHNTTRVNVAIDSRGMFGTMNTNPLRNLNVGGSDILKYGDLNVFTGAYSNTSSYIVTDVTPVNTYGNAVKTYTYYTTDNTTAVPANGLKANITATGIVQPDPFGGTNTVILPDNTTIPFNNNAFKLTYNNSYNLNVRLIESGVKVGGLTWARSNLAWWGISESAVKTKIFDPNPKRPYDINANGRYYFYWGINVPGDYCVDVYPAGVWRMPTIDELESTFKNRAYNTRLYYNTNTSGAPNGMAGIEYELDPGSVINTAYPELSQKLFFPMAGQAAINGTSFFNHGFSIKATDGKIDNLEINIWALQNPRNYDILQWVSVYNEDGTSRNLRIKNIARLQSSATNRNIRCVRK
ncbi:MAG: hypothetical protein LBE39_06050 [Flavobacteriaceae bacterium]|jgi:hypothetical protein|nr:hypothetical protein [Flavobacteriaceae bacterium]